MCCCTNTYYCADTGQTICLGTESIVSATGGYTPAQIAKGLPGQCPQGPGGATGFPACVTGPGIKINRCQIASGLSCKILGWFGCHVTEPAQAAWDKVKADVKALPSVTTILVVLFIAFLAAVFVYGFAKSR